MGFGNWGRQLAIAEASLQLVIGHLLPRLKNPRCSGKGPSGGNLLSSANTRGFRGLLWLFSSDTTSTPLRMGSGGESGSGPLRATKQQYSQTQKGGPLSGEKNVFWWNKPIQKMGKNWRALSRFWLTKKCLNYLDRLERWRGCTLGEKGRRARVSGKLGKWTLGWVGNQAEAPV